jgi:hypothetical protein
MIYTVGHEKNYDEHLAGPNAAKFKKLGRRKKDGYPGGFAAKTPEDAMRIIDEMGKGREWAVYEVDADWERDTAPSENGWWHALIKTSRIIRKVDVPALPVRFIDESNRPAAAYKEILDAATQRVMELTGIPDELMTRLSGHERVKRRAGRPE